MRVFFGDSHIRTFFLDYWGPAYAISWFSGATAQGLLNSNSRSGAGPVIKEFLAIPVVTEAYFMFGSVDMDFVLIKKLHENNKLSIDSYVDTVVNKYVDFIVELPCPVNVLGIHLPTTSNEFVVDNVANSTGLDRSAVAKVIYDFQLDDKFRTQLAISFNNKLGKLLEEKGFCFYRIDGLMLNDLGTVADKYVFKKWDHHANKMAVLSLWGDVLNAKFPILQKVLKYPRN